MSNCERITQVAQDKWAIRSKSLRSLMTNERPRERFAQVAHDKWAIEQFAQKSLAKKSKILFFSMFYIRFFHLKNERFAHSLFFNEQCEQIAPVDHQKWAMWANRSSHSPKMSDHERLAQVTHPKMIDHEPITQVAQFFWANRLNRSFFCKKRAIRSENQCTNSQPWSFPSNHP